MYRCPKCTIELPADARFCARCGFNQTNARMNSVASQPTRQSQTPSPASAQPNLAQTPPVRVIQPTVRQIPPHPGMVAPVRTNTPPKASSSPSIPVRPSAKMAAQQGQQSAPASRTPQQAANGAQPHAVSLTQRYTPNQAAQQPPFQIVAKPLQQTPQAGQARQMGQVQPPLQPLAFQPAPTPTPATPPSIPPSAPPNRPPTTSSVPPLTPMALMPKSPLHSQSMAPPPGQAAYQSAPPFGGAMVPMAVAQTQMGVHQGQNGIQGHAESLAATNKAADHWRKSWVDRQRAEAGPAIGITRGQASVPEPLMAMQNSFIRLRAIVLNNNQKKQDGFGFWITVVMMLCLIGGLGAYIISTYLPSAQLQTKIAATNDSPQAMLTLSGKTTTVTVGQTLHVHGDYFGAHDTIIFHLNSQTLHSLHDPVQSSSSGSFDASFSLATTLVGSYILEALDNQVGKHAFLSLEVLPKPNTSTTNTTALSLTNREGQALTTLTFTIPFGQDATPPRDNVFLHNTSNDAPLQWTAATITDDGNWLVLDDAQTGGQIDRSGTAILGISTLATGLKVGKYRGDIVFTINGTSQVLLPVTFQLVEASTELVINPNPLIAGIMAGGACLSDTSITLINLSNTPVNWDVKGNSSFDQQHILIDNKTGEGGMLMVGDTQVLKISCVGVKLGENLYRVTVYYNGQQTLIPISIRASV